MRRRNKKTGFTLIELMVSMTVLSVLLALIFAIIDQAARSWSSAGAKVGQFKEARAAMGALTLRLSQATLNTYWGYDNPTLPARYLPQSELHFVTGNAADLVGGGSPSHNPGHAVFFLAPLGFTAGEDLRHFTGLLNACGFYIEYASDASFRPAPLASAGSEERWRFRLMEYRQPAESLQIYNHADLSEADRYSLWHRDEDGDANRPLAENIIALVLAPMSSREEAAATGLSPYAAAPNFTFDSREQDPEKRHQLPPMIRVIMVAIDEGSAIRLELGETPPQLIPDGLFVQVDDEADLLEDIAALERSLIERRIDFRTFQSVVPLRAAKWSPGT